MDYRNLNIKFALEGLNVASPPELLNPGQLTRALNLRPSVEGVIEARPLQGTFNFTQPILNGYTSPYPSNWSTGPTRLIKYVGNVTVGGASVAGYIVLHDDLPLPLGKSDSGYRTFVNGGIVRKREAYSTYSALDPTGLSVVRTNAANGIDIILLDGSWYIPLKDFNFDSPPATSSINTGYTTLTTVPTFTAKRLGIPKPANAPTLAAQGTGLTGTYYYRVSGYDSTTGFQGPPSAISAGLALSNQGCRVTFTDTNTYGNFDYFRVWRMGGTITSWRLVGSVASTNAGSSIYLDDTTTDANAALAELLDSSSVEVFNTITTTGATSTGQKFLYAFGPFVGKYVFWVGDPVRKNYIYWNKLTDLSRHDPSYDVNAVSDPAEVLINGFVFGNSPYVLSGKKLYALDFAGADAQPAFEPREVPIGIGLAGRYSFAVAPNMVFICSKDGIYITDCQPGAPVNIVEKTLRPIFRGEDSGALEAIDYSRADEIRMAATNKELHFLYRGKTTGKMFHLVYEVEGAKWFQWTTDTTGSVYPNEAVSWNQLLLGDVHSQNVRSFDDSVLLDDESCSVNFRSGAADIGAPLTHKEWGVLILDFDPNSVNITITPYYNSEEVAGTALNTNTEGDDDGRRVTSFSLGDYYARSLSLDLSWTEEPNRHPRFYQALILYREDEEDIKHWEHPPQALGQEGPYHVKDSYWGIRSTAAVTLKVNVDGHEDIYPDALASTGGLRKKLYLELLPRLGNVWGFTLESSAPFRFYGEDTLLRAKGWQKGSSYQVLNPFSQAGYASFLRKGGGT